MARKGTFVTMPGSVQRRVWDAVVILVQLANVALLLGREWWRQANRGWLYYDLEWPHTEMLHKVQTLIDVLVILDILINFRTAYRCEGGDGSAVAPRSIRKPSKV